MAANRNPRWPPCAGESKQNGGRTESVQVLTTATNKYINYLKDDVA